ncbi:YqzE family protein [Paenibacillus sp. D2_2]|uniref:YqzE family protein n=1 Tax=Paenibacillus sp. D2_2 TaxID=3073092 RepID=UPI0028152D7E|nr:YqzE family protein [Paenibacillus sp. D2_2]WMT39355.1 YqzE family protein [Paenibacillus sp. D2_2]
MTTKSDELVRYITERVVDYVETPKEVRRERSHSKPSWAQTWFGMIPFSISLWFRQIPFHRLRTKEWRLKGLRIKGIRRDTSS